MQPPGTADGGEADGLFGVGGPVFAPQEGRESGFELDHPLGIADPAVRGVGPAMLSGAQLVALCERRERPGEIPPCQEGGAEADVGPGVVGLEPEDRLVLVDGLLRIARAGQRGAEVVVGRGVVGLVLQRLAELGDGRVRLTLAGQRGAEADVGRGVVGPELQGLAELGDGPVLIALVGQRGAEVVVGQALSDWSFTAARNWSMAASA